MKQKIWFHFFSSCFFILLANTTFSINSYATSTPADQVEQGEEDYSALKAHTSADAEPFPINTTLPEAHEDTTKDQKKGIKLKDFQEEIKSKKEGLDAKAGAKIQTPVTHDEKTVLSDLKDSDEKENIVEKEKDIKIEHNKLVEPGDKIVEEKKANGVIWFFAVFAVLIVVIFAFT